MGISGSSLPDHTRRRCDHAYGVSDQGHYRTGGRVDPLVAMQTHVSGCMSFN